MMKHALVAILAISLAACSTAPSQPTSTSATTTMQETQAPPANTAATTPAKVKVLVTFIGIDSKQVPGGMKVTDINAKAPAYAAGLRKGDVILAANDRTTPKPADLRTIVRGAKPGQVIVLHVNREGATLDFRVVAGAKMECQDDDDDDDDDEDEFDDEDDEDEDGDDDDEDDDD